MMEDNVPGFIGYHITRDGKLYSRRIERSPYKFGKWHKLRLSKKARVKVKLYKDGRGYNLSISRLVALVYVYNPNPSKFNEVMHLDNNPLNNYYRNLQWGTHKENTWDSINKGRWSNPPYGSGLDSPRSLLKSNVRKQRRIIRLSSLGFNYKDIGLKVGLSPKVISRYLRIRNSLE